MATTRKKPAQAKPARRLTSVPKISRLRPRLNRPEPAAPSEPIQLESQPAPAADPALLSASPGNEIQSDGAHLAAVTVAAEPGAAPPEPEFGPATAEHVGGDGLIDRAVWCATFGELLAAGGQLARLKTLEQAASWPSCRPAAEALYDTARDVPALQFLIRPGNVWIGRALAIGMFALPLANGVKVELLARRQPAAGTNSDKVSEPAAEPAPSTTAGTGYNA